MQSKPVINAPSKGKRLLTEIVKNREIYLLVIPAVIWYIVMCYFPMGGLSLAFKSYKGKLGIWGSPWVGWKHFQMFFGSATAGTIIKNTFLLSLTICWQASRCRSFWRCV